MGGCQAACSLAPDLVSIGYKVTFLTRSLEGGRDLVLIGYKGTFLTHWDGRGQMTSLEACGWVSCGVLIGAWH